MCLVANRLLTRDWRERIQAAGGVLTVYKKVLVLDDRLTSHGEFLWTHGWNHAEGELPSRIGDRTEIMGGGFHVYLERPQPASELRHRVKVVVPLRARLEDFVAAGNCNEGVFRRLYLEPADHEAAWKRDREQPSMPDLLAQLEAMLRRSGLWERREEILRTNTPISYPYERWQTPRPNEHWSERFAQYDEGRTRNTWVRRALVDVTPGNGREPVVWLQYDGARRDGRRRIERRSIGVHEHSWMRRDPDPAA